MVCKPALEDVECPLCQSTDRDACYHFPPYAVQRCQQCGLYYLSPRLSEAEILNIYRNDAYFEGNGSGYTTYTDQEVALRLTFRRFLRAMQQQRLTSESLLEIGCGYGYLLDEARSYFSVRTGTDFSPQAAQMARRYADVIYEGGLDAIPAHARFDCIVANNLIEHIYDPRAFMAELCQHLKPGGVIVLATPHMGSFWRHLMGHRWPSFKLPEHVLYFDQATLANLLRQSGLQGVGEIPYPHAFPLALVAAKLHMSLPNRFRQISVWMPQTMVAMYGRLDD